MAPWDGSENYQYPLGTPGIPDTTIESNKYNTFLDDIVANDLNKPRPIHRGGTAGTSALTARLNLKTEVTLTSPQAIVTDYLAQSWENGSFQSQAGAVNSPDGVGAATNVYWGTCWTDGIGVYIEARSMTDNKLFTRKKTGAGWGAWIIGDGAQPYVMKTGDVMSGDLGITKSEPRLVLNKTAMPQTDGIAALNNNIPRWLLCLGDNTAEGSANAGSNFSLYRYNDTGAFLGNALFISRANGNAGFGATGPVIVAAAGSRTLTISSDASPGAIGILELNSTAPSAAGMGSGAMIFTTTTGLVSGTTKVTAQINSNLAASGVSGNFGGELTFYTKTNGGGLAPAFYVRNDQVVQFKSSIVVEASVVYFGTSGYAISQSGGTFSFNGGVGIGGNLDVSGSTNLQNVNAQNLAAVTDIQAADSSGFGGGTTAPGNADIRAPNGSIGARTAFIGASYTDYYNVLAGGNRGGWSVMADIGWDSGAGWQGLALRNYHFGLDGTYILFSGSSNETLGWIQGNGNGTLSYISSSDATLKEDVHDLRETVDSLDLIRRLTARSFKFKAADKHTVGLIAQEVNEVLGHGNNVVVEGKNITLPGPDGKDRTNYLPWGISYGDLVPYLIDAIGTMAARIEELEARK